jgi:hypothetical protein
VHERCDYTDLLAIAAREVLDPPVEVEVHPLGEVLVACGRYAAAHPADELEEVAPLHPVVQCEVAGQVSDLGAQSHAVAHDVEAEHLTTATCRVDQGRGSSGWLSSCRPR